MSHTPHELAEEFPQDIDLMRKLKADNAHFEQLSEQYHTINRAIHRAETDVDPTDDLHLGEMRKTRMRLKDDIAAILRNA